MITFDRAKELLDYNPDTGQLLWKESRGRVKAGSVAGGLDGKGYVTVRIDNKHYRGHRICWLLYYGTMPNQMLDHINRNKADNRISNLREVNNSENMRNTNNRKDNTSGTKCISYHTRKGKWRWVEHEHGKHVHRGYYDTYEAAIKAKTWAELKELN